MSRRDMDRDRDRRRAARMGGMGGMGGMAGMRGMGGMGMGGMGGMGGMAGMGGMGDIFGGLGGFGGGMGGLGGLMGMMEGGGYAMREPPANPEELKYDVEKWNSYINELIKGRWDETKMTFILRTFNVNMKRNGKEYSDTTGRSAVRLPIPGKYFDAVRSVTATTRKLCEEYSKTTSSVVLTVMICAHEVLKNVVANEPSTEVDEPLVNEISKDRLAIQEIVTAACIRMAETSALREKEVQRLSVVRDSQYLADIVVKRIKEWAARLPYGKHSSGAFAFLMEFIAAIKLARDHWSKIIGDILEAPSDSRRAAELLLWQAHPKSTAARLDDFAPVLLDANEADSILHHAADGVPPEEVWGLLGEDSRIDQAKQEARGGGGGGDLGDELHGMGRMRRGGDRAIIGRWVCDGGLELRFHQKSREQIKVDVMITGSETQSAVCLKLENDPFPQCPYTKIVPHFGVGLEDWLLWVPLPSSDHHSFTDHVRLTVILGDRNTDKIHKIVFQKDEIGGETVVAFASRVLQTSLKAPPATDLYDKCKKAFNELPGFASSLLQFLGDRGDKFNVRHCYPETLIVVLRAIEDSDPKLKGSISGPKGWLHNQAIRHPCINLISVFGLAFEEKDLQPTPTGVMASLKLITQTEVRQSGDPLAVVNALSLVSRHDFDGGWTWLNGLHNRNYPDAFIVTGHHIALNHPALSSGVISDVKYHELELRFKITIKRERKAERFSLADLDLQASRDKTFNVTLSSTRGAVRCPDSIDGSWSSATDTPQTCTYKRSTIGTATCVWGKQAIAAVLPLLRDQIAQWDARWLETHASVPAISLIRRVFADRQKKDHSKDYGDFILNLWGLCCERIVITQKTHELDNWMLSESTKRMGVSEMSGLTGMRQDAANALLTVYFQSRAVKWDSVPVDLNIVRQLSAGKYPSVKAFSTRIETATKEFQTRLNAHRISRHVYSLSKQHESIHLANGIKFPVLDFNAPIKNLEHSGNVLRELVEHWEVKGAGDLLNEFTNSIVRKELVNLDDLEKLVKKAEVTLGDALTLPHATSSPLLRAHFLTLCNHKGVMLDNFQNSFREACESLSSIKLNSTIEQAVAGLHPPDGNYEQGRKRQEKALMERIGADKEAVDALLDGGLPLRFVVHDLEILRRMVNSPHKELKFHSQFFSEDERRILLDDDLSKVTLKDAKQRSTEIKRVSCGCEHRVLEIMRTVYNCTELVEFTRDNPEAQDEGLASVLSNSRDLQHASFQTFFNLTNFVNPFVWASSAYVEMFNEKRMQLIQEKVDAGEKGDLPYSAAEMRIPISNSGFIAGSDITGDGFWSLMNNSFGDDTLQDVRNIQKKLEKMTAVDEIEKLVKMIKEQSGTTDRMIIVCHYASGLQGIPEGILVDEDDYIDRSSALIIINLPTTGQPTLEFNAHDGKVRNMAEYSDLVYRATLQRNEHSSLEIFANQAREVMRAFNTACSLFSEGHIEFRSRRVTFRHDDAARLTQMLQSLEGQWAKDSESTTSLFVTMCEKYPELICVTPAELVRTAELMRSTAALSNSIQDTTRLANWRRGKMKMIQRVEKTSAVQEGGSIEDVSIKVQPTPLQTKKGASVSHKLKEDAEPLLFEGLGVCDGEYHKSLWTYRREDGLVLSPVAGGWVVYDKPVMNARRLLVSMSDNESYLQPWQMGDWRESDSHGFLNEQPCLSAKVQADDAFTVVEKWSDDCRGAEHNIHVQNGSSLKPVGLKEMASTLYVTECPEFSFWESVGFEAGMRIVAVNNKRTKKIADLAKEFRSEAGKNKPNFTVTVIPAYIWLVCSKSAEISANGREVAKVRGTAPAMAISPAPAKVWRIKITGDVFASRIGLCTKELEIGKPVDESPNKESAYWYMRNGTLRHNGMDVDNARAFRSGDIITVIFDQKAKTIDFKLNGRRNLARFTDVKGSLRPCVYLVNKTARAVISPGEPVDEVTGWNPTRIGKGLKINGATVVSEVDTATVALGNRVMVGPGPHTFSIHAKGRTLNDFLSIGVAAPGVPLDKVSDGETSMFGMRIKQNGSVFVLKDTSNMGTTTAQNAQEFTFTFTIDLGEGSIGCLCDGERIFSSVTTKDFPKADGPLVPYVLFNGKDVHCTFVSSAGPQSASDVDSASVVIKGTTPADSREKDGLCDGLYKRWLPTYSRADGKYKMMHWDDRWCVTDASERPVAWSNPCKGDAKIGSEPLRWTVVDGFQEKPHCIRVVSKSHPGGILTLQSQADKQGFVVYENSELRLSRDRKTERWVVAYKNSKGGEGLYMSSSDQPFPHYCTKWTWGDGRSWREGARVNVLACSPLEELRKDKFGLYWNHHEFGHDWYDLTTKVDIPSLQSVDIRPVVQLQATVSRSSIDSMTEDELAVWHTIEKSTGAVCRAAELRLALKKAAAGSKNGLELFTDWESTEQAQSMVAEGALSTLERIGKLLQIMRSNTKGAKDPRISCNYDPAAARYGQLQTRTVEGSIVDTSRLAVSDRKLFSIALHEGDVRPYHVLDCTAQTPAENVRAFLQLYKQTKKGRLVVMNLNLLSPDQQNEVRLATEAKYPEKELLAVVTGGDGSDETVEFVDNLSCDVKWKKWAMARCCELNNFKSITYYLQKCGTGKSYSIEKKIKSGEFGNVLPTRLDLDSTKNSLDDICNRLMGPMRERHGLLVIHVGQDTDPQIVNQVLDSLIFFGRIESNSGLAVSIPKKTWHLVVEFQHPPDAKESLGREKDVNGPWKRPNGTTDITLLACTGLASPGVLEPFDIKAVPGAPEALDWIKDNLNDIECSNDIHTLKLICLGHDTVEVEALPEVRKMELEAEMETITSRMLVRSLKHLVYQYKMYVHKQRDPSSQKRTKKQVLVVRMLMHEMHTMIKPDSPDNVHFVVMTGTIKQRMEFSMDQLLVNFDGEPVTAIQKLRKAMLEEAEERIDFMLSMSVDKGNSSEQKEKMRANAAKQREERAKAPLYTLIDSLADEVCIEKKTALTALRGRNYVLIPDFLQKLVQMYCHLRIQDPPILQGPSGTGKSYAVSMLSELLQLPPNASAAFKREGHNDLVASFNRFVRTDPELKKLFSDGEADVKVGKNGIMISATMEEAQHPPVKCMRLLADKGDFEALDYLRECVNDVLGPLIADEASNPDIAAVVMHQRKQYFRDSIEVMKKGVPASMKKDGNEKECVELLFSALEEIVKSLAVVSGGFLVGQIRDTMAGVLSSSHMQKLAGASYGQMQSILTKKHSLDASIEWAKEAFTAAKSNGPALCRAVRAELRNQIRLSPILDPPPSLLRDLSDGGENSGEALADLVRRTLTLQRSKSSLIILMRYDMTVEMLYEQMSPMLEKALRCPTINFMIMIDEMNATNMLGLVKRIVVDRYWDRWELEHPESNGILPANVSFLGAVNPTTKDAALEGLDEEEAGPEESEKMSKEAGEKLGFDVTPMQPALKEHIVPWKQLAANQREMFITRLMGSNRNLFAASVRQSQLRALSDLLLHTHKFAQRAVAHKRSTVSQRDIHRTMKLFDFFYKQGVDYISFNGQQAVDVWDRVLSAMTVAMACSYYFRFPPEQRAALSKTLTERLEQLAEADEEVRSFPQGVAFDTVVQRAVSYHCHSDHLKLPDAVYAHQGLMENLFVQMVCFDLRLAVILQGAPGTSKTLSNNIIRDNMQGCGQFWKDFCHISDICRYQGSAQSSADEIKKKCEEAYQKQVENDSSGTLNKRTLLFVDEAGLVKGATVERKWALKVLHYYLEGANLASVLMTNTSLDTAIGNRCVTVFMAKPRPEELTNMCAGILSKQGMKGLCEMSKLIIPACCDAFHKLVPPPKEDEEETLVGFDPSLKFRWWFGLRDLFHMMRYIRRNNNTEGGGLITVNPELVLRAMERNFNGPSEFFEAALKKFGQALGEVDASYSAEAFRPMLRRKLDVVIDSLKDNNRATEKASGKNLNDMWVRFKLLVDTTEDGSMLQLLRQTGVEQFNNLSVLSLSALSYGDELMPVTVVSQIVAAMEAGRTVWLTNTRDIDACLFDVFNQNYVVASSGTNETLHFVAVAVGAALEYKRVHRDFQCIVHVTKRELTGMGNVLPSPFLNRLEKFPITVQDILEFALAKLTPEEREAAMEVRTKLARFQKTLAVRNKCLFGDSDVDTFDSVILEAVQQGTLIDLPMNERIRKDDALDGFLAGSNAADARWKASSCRMLQVLKPEGMLLAQRVLKKDAPAYLRAYFRDLAPWDLTGYLRDLRGKVAPRKGQVAGGEDSEWLRSVVFSPSNADFPSLLEPIPNLTHLSLDGLLESERGQEDLKEELYRFTTDPDQYVFVLIMSPDSLGKPECREVRYLLSSRPDVREKEKCLVTDKAVVIIQSFQNSSLTEASNCTPLFGSGWDQVYLDAAAEHVKLDLQQYVDPMIVGKRAPRPIPEWRDLEFLLDRAMNTLMQAQSEAATKWVPVPEDDPASALYDLKRPFDEQVAVAKKLFRACPRVKKVIVKFYRARQPTELELVEMAKEVAAQDGQSLSLAQRLIDEENKAPRALLTFALRFLLDDRNASALLALASQKGREKELAKSDTIVAKALEVASRATTFDILRRKKVSTLDTIYVGVSIPSLPGSSSIIETLPVPSSAVDVVQTAKELEEKHDDEMVRELVEAVHSDQQLVLAFLRDHIRCRVRYSNIRIVENVLNWVFELVRGLHQSYFPGKDETVWSIRALCSVMAAAIDDYIMAMVPLAAMGALDNKMPPSIIGQGGGGGQNAAWVAHELGPQLLLEAFPKMVAKNLVEFKTACSSMLHRVNSEWIVESKHAPCLSIIGAVISGLETLDKKSIDLLQSFIKSSCKGSSGGAIPVDLKIITSLLKEHPESTCKVALQLASLSRDFRSDKAVPPFVINLVIKNPDIISRAMSARIIRQLNETRGSGVTAPTELMENAEMQAWIQAAAEQETGKKMGPKCDSYKPNGKNAEKAMDSRLYLAVYDVCYDNNLGMDAEHVLVDACLKHCSVHDDLLSRSKKASPQGKAVLTIMMKAVEAAFIISLAVVFMRPTDQQNERDWAPSFMKDEETVKTLSRLAKKVFEPPGFKCPERLSANDSKLIDSPPDAEIENSLLTFMHTLESGVGSLRGMGTKSMLLYMQDQVAQSSSGKIGALPTICGEAMRHKCQNSEPLKAKSGDLPFVVDIEDPLHTPFLQLQREMMLSGDIQSTSLEQVTKVVKMLVDMVPKHGVEKSRLLLFYVAFKCFFGERAVHPMADKFLSEKQLSSSLQLDAKLLRVLGIALDAKKCKDYSDGEVDLFSSLMRGFDNDWTEMIITALCVACAYPKSFMGTMFFDIDAQKHRFIPGDKTGGDVTHGGCYKFDCVTQLDENGAIASYSRGQEVLSTGACYLLWAVEFGALALQLTLWPECFRTLWEWMFSPTIRERVHGYQQGISDYRHLVHQMTERSIAYHLHMGVFTGLSIDETQKIFSFFISSLSTSDKLVKNSSFKSRSEAMDAEREVEALWKRYTTTDRKLLTKPQQDACHALRVLTNWKFQHFVDLPREGSIRTAIERLSAEETPELLTMALHENVKLSLLAPLLTDLYSFSNRVQRMLSNRLLLKYTDEEDGDELMTPYRSVLELFREHTHESQYEIAVDELRRIQDTWNRFMMNVGPIDFECQQGGINVLFEDIESGGNVPGLPGTLDFWLTFADSPYPQHKNMIKAALTSLTDKYNKCQAIVAKHTKIQIEDVDLSSFSPTRPDLLLQELGHSALGEVCRSHAVYDNETRSFKVDWLGIEKELSFASGLILPKIEMPYLAPFRFRDPEEPVVSSEVEQSALDLLTIQPDRHCTKLTPKQEEELRKNTKGFTEDNVTQQMLGLVATFKAHDTDPNENLYQAMKKRWIQKTTMPLTPQALPKVTVSQVREVIMIFLEKMEQGDWLTSHIGFAFLEKLPDELTASIEDKYLLYLQDNAIEEVVEVLEAVDEYSCLFLESLENPKQPLMDIISDVLMGDDGICEVFEGVLCEHIVHFIRLVKKKLRKLRESVTQNSWREDGGRLTELPYVIVINEDESYDELGLMYDDDLIITTINDGPISRSKLERGMRIVAINDTRVHTRDQIENALQTVKNQFEISVEIDLGDDDELDRAASNILFEKEEAGDFPRQGSTMSGLPRLASGIGARQPSRDLSGDASTPLQRKSSLRVNQSGLPSMVSRGGGSFCAGEEPTTPDAGVTAAKIGAMERQNSSLLKRNKKEKAGLQAIDERLLKRKIDDREEIARLQARLKKTEESSKELEARCSRLQKALTTEQSERKHAEQLAKQTAEQLRARYGDGGADHDEEMPDFD
eukprot:TRINITY_DN279_c0_g1_i11.p1 TRINITY_DN279_c0_g1~~TRINITY_DN279_c0_g1_i11.p1  ORF type:complete len:6268 (+),score=1323.50 TRINITY_DN279_c0_g1_i11:127-18930(+)